MEYEPDNQPRLRVIISSLEALLLAGLVVFLLTLPFHLVIKKLVPDPIGTYWKEGLLGLLCALYILRALLARQSPFMRSRLEGAVLIYVALILVRLLLDRSGVVGWWGFYISVLYLPLFWLTPAVLQSRPNWFLNIMALLVAVGAVIALGGLVEFLINKPLWPSDEIIDRQGFSDVFIYGTHLRRVYFVLDSPTALANILAMLLPISLAFTLITQTTRSRLVATLATFLMAACIVVTFSRGIWVAMVIALFFMALLGGVIQKNRRTQIVALGSLVVGGLVWGAVMVFKTGGDVSPTIGVFELASKAYQAIPITEQYMELIEIEPLYGDVVTQTWTLYDPIERRDDTRTVLYEHPSQSEKIEIIYKVEVPEDSALRFSIALSPEVWSSEKGDGASFQIFVSTLDERDAGEFIFVRYINPKSNPSDRRWRNFLVDLSPWAGSTLRLSLVVEAGPSGDWAYDWAGWADLQVVSLPPGYFAGVQTQNAVIDHTSSILDSARDETNRDRVAAWNLSLNAWRTNPLWGTGLGTTGAAALRTLPENSFVTESQVLKALTEFGLPGLFVFAYLWFQIGRTGYQLYRSSYDNKVEFLRLGILTSLLIVFIDGLVYQNLEVKQVNAYFWTLVGILAFISQRRDE